MNFLNTYYLLIIPIHHIIMPIITRHFVDELCIDNNSDGNKIIDLIILKSTESVVFTLYLKLTNVKLYNIII